MSVSKLQWHLIMNDINWTSIIWVTTHNLPPIKRWRLYDLHKYNTLTFLI